MLTLRTIENVNDSAFRLFAVESAEVQCNKGNVGCLMYANVEPIAVIVCGVDGAYALDMYSERTDLEQLRQQIPELDAVIAPHIGARS